MVARLQFVVDNPCYESFSTPSANYRRSRMAKLEIELKSPSFSNTKMVPMLVSRSANSVTCYNR